MPRYTSMKSLCKVIKRLYFFFMQEIFPKLNHKDRKSIKKHMPGFVTKDTNSDSGDST